MPIPLRRPKEVGADRVANAIGAFHLYGGPTVVVDMGTATTFDAISAAGRVPGPGPSPRASGSAWRRFSSTPPP